MLAKAFAEGMMFFSCRSMHLCVHITTICALIVKITTQRSCKAFSSNLGTNTHLFYSCGSQQKLQVFHLQRMQTGAYAHGIHVRHEIALIQTM